MNEALMLIWLICLNIINVQAAVVVWRVSQTGSGIYQDTVSDCCYECGEAVSVQCWWGIDQEAVPGDWTGCSYLYKKRYDIPIHSICASTCASYIDICPSGSYINYCYGYNKRVGISVNLCNPCSQCSTGYYQTTPCTNNDKHDTKCEKCRDCVAGSEYQTAPCTATTDRTCTACSACGANQYETTACSGTQNRGCTACSACPAGKYKSGGCTGTQNTICTACPLNSWSNEGSQSQMECYCLNHYYKQSENGMHCVHCPDGKTGAGIGSISEETGCRLCEVNTYWKKSDSTCALCPRQEITVFMDYMMYSFKNVFFWVDDSSIIDYKMYNHLFTSCSSNISNTCPSNYYVVPYMYSSGQSYTTYQFECRRCALTNPASSCSIGQYNLCDGTTSKPITCFNCPSYAKPGGNTQYLWDFFKANMQGVNSCQWKCAAGYYRADNLCISCSEARDELLKACTIGTYLLETCMSSSGSSTAPKCQGCTNKIANSAYSSAGKVINSDTSCEYKCNSGFFLNQSTEACQPWNEAFTCPYGHVRLPPTHLADYSCMFCLTDLTAANSLSTSIQNRMTFSSSSCSSMQCARGTTYDSTQQSCVECLPGYYKDDISTSACKLCSQSSTSYSPNFGQVSCLESPANSQVWDNRSSFSCNIGFWKKTDNFGQHTCETCPIPVHSIETATVFDGNDQRCYLASLACKPRFHRKTSVSAQGDVLQECTPCPAITVSQMVVNTSTEISQDHGLTVQSICGSKPDNSPCTAQDEINLACYSNVMCNDGYYLSSTATASTKSHDKTCPSCLAPLTACVAGQTTQLCKSPNNRNSCSPCSYQLKVGQIWTTGCSWICDIGFYLSNAGTSTCSACTQGKFKATVNTDNACSLCSNGYYAANAGSSACTSCEVGKYTNTSGLETLASCKICPAGAYTNSSYAATQCITCPVATYNPTAEKSSCLACTDESFPVSSQDRTYCTLPSAPCPSGFFLPSVSFDAEYNSSMITLIPNTSTRIPNVNLLCQPCLQGLYCLGNHQLYACDPTLVSNGNPLLYSKKASKNAGRCMVSSEINGQCSASVECPANTHTYGYTPCTIQSCHPMKGYYGIPGSPAKPCPADFYCPEYFPQFQKTPTTTPYYPQPFPYVLSQSKISAYGNRYSQIHRYWIHLQQTWERLNEQTSVLKADGFAIPSIGTPIYVLSDSSQIYKINSVSDMANPVLIAGSTNKTTGYADGVGTNARFNFENKAVISPDDRFMIIADYENSKLRKMTLTAEGSTPQYTVTTIVDGSDFGNGAGPGNVSGILRPKSLDFHPSGEWIIVIDFGDGFGAGDGSIKKVSLTDGEYTVSTIIPRYEFDVETTTNASFQDAKIWRPFHIEFFANGSMAFLSSQSFMTGYADFHYFQIMDFQLNRIYVAAYILNFGEFAFLNEAENTFVYSAVKSGVEYGQIKLPLYNVYNPTAFRYNSYVGSYEESITPWRCNNRGARIGPPNEAWKCMPCEPGTRSTSRGVCFPCETGLQSAGGASKCEPAYRTTFKFDSRNGYFRIGPDGSHNYFDNMDSKIGTVQISDGTLTINSQTIPKGFQVWTVGTSAQYDIVAAGAAGGDDTSASFARGRGAVIKSTFVLSKGDIVLIVVGQRGSMAASCGSGGGGGTFMTKYDATGPVSDHTKHTIVLIAGGGGGESSGVASQSEKENGMDANFGTPGTLHNGATTGTASTAGGGGGGGGGNGGSGGADGSMSNTSPGTSAGGAGFRGNGAAGTLDIQYTTFGGTAFLQGATGGWGRCLSPSYQISGGFGGGGAAWNGGGGGGGYSGGQGPPASARNGGGGGGSYDGSNAIGGFNATPYVSWDTSVFGIPPKSYESSGYNREESGFLIVSLFGGSQTPIQTMPIACPASTPWAPSLSTNVSDCSAQMLPPCRPGYFINFDTSTSQFQTICTACPQGSYCPGGTQGNSLFQCAYVTNAYMDTPSNSSSVAACTQKATSDSSLPAGLACPTNTRFMSGTTLGYSVLQCTANPGYYFVPKLHTQAFRCPVGYYCPGTNNRSHPFPISCPSTLSSCASVGLGYLPYSSCPALGLSSPGPVCETCANAGYQALPANARYAGYDTCEFTCNDGYYKVPTVANPSLSQCNSVPDASSCLVGHYAEKMSSDAGAPIACKPCQYFITDFSSTWNQYMYANFATPISVDFRKNLTLEGKIPEFGQDSCQWECKAGSYYDINTKACTACPAGKFNSQDIFNKTACDDCAPGFYASTLGYTSCMECGTWSIPY